MLLSSFSALAFCWIVTKSQANYHSKQLLSPMNKMLSVNRIELIRFGRCEQTIFPVSEWYKIDSCSFHTPDESIWFWCALVNNLPVKRVPCSLYRVDIISDDLQEHNYPRHFIVDWYHPKYFRKTKSKYSKSCATRHFSFWNLPWRLNKIIILSCVCNRYLGIESISWILNFSISSICT